MKNLTPRELATVLAALRYAQRTLVFHAGPPSTNIDYELSWPYQETTLFNDEDSLSVNEIDTLCEQLNVGDEEPKDNTFYGYAREDFDNIATEYADINDVEGGYHPDILNAAWEHLEGGSHEYINEQLHEQIKQTIDEENDKYLYALDDKEEREDA